MEPLYTSTGNEYSLHIVTSGAMNLYEPVTPAKIGTINDHDFRILNLSQCWALCDRNDGQVSHLS